MIQTLVSNYRARDIYSIDTEFYRSHGVKTLIIDLDNAFERYSLKKPSGQALSLSEEIRAVGVTIVLLSKSRAKDLSEYAHHLKAALICSKRNRRVRTIRRFLETNEISLSDVMLIGASKRDDMEIAAKLNVESIWTDYLYIGKSFHAKIKYKREKKALERACKNRLEGQTIPARKTEVQYV